MKPLKSKRNNGLKDERWLILQFFCADSSFLGCVRCDWVFFEIEMLRMAKHTLQDLDFDWLRALFRDLGLEFT